MCDLRGELKCISTEGEAFPRGSAELVPVGCHLKGPTSRAVHHISSLRASLGSTVGCSSCTTGNGPSKLSQPSHFLAFQWVLSATGGTVRRQARGYDFWPAGICSSLLISETLYGCGKFQSHSKPLEFQTVARGFETHRVNWDFCGINEKMRGS